MCIDAFPCILGRRKVWGRSQARSGGLQKGINCRRSRRHAHSALVAVATQLGAAMFAPEGCSTILKSTADRVTVGASRKISTSFNDSLAPTRAGQRCRGSGTFEEGERLAVVPSALRPRGSHFSSRGKLPRGKLRLGGAGQILCGHRLGEARSRKIWSEAAWAQVRWGPLSR